MSWIDRTTARLVGNRLGRITCGSLTVHEDGATTVHGDPGDADGPHAALTVHRPRFWRAIALGGHNGAAESYMREEWSTDDLPGLIRLFVRNRDVVSSMEGGWARLAAPVRAVAHALRRNTRRGARRNVHEHYDLGNDFYRLFLDETLTYSCGIFESPDASLRDAAIAKYDRLCRKLDLRAEHHVLEIGGGWGGFAIHAAGRYGCRVTTTTISAEQHAEAVRRVAEAGLADRVTVLRRDYRDLDGRYDRIVSIEMIEQVGHAYYETYFRKCRELLEPDGLIAIQAITIRDEQYDRARREVDFIKRYIFPGSCIPSVARLAQAVARATDLRLMHLEDIGAHYATTLRRWRERFLARAADVTRLGFPRRFVRMWEFYFSYCEGGYAERYLGDVQLVLAAPDNRRPPIR